MNRREALATMAAAVVGTAVPVTAGACVTSEVVDLSEYDYVHILNCGLMSANEVRELERIPISTMDVQEVARKYRIPPHLLQSLVR